MQRIQITLQKRLNQHKITAVTQAATVLHFANAYLGTQLNCESGQVKATVLKNATLWIETANPILAQEVWGSSLELLNLIREKHPSVKVSHIRTKALTEA